MKLSTMRQLIAFATAAAALPGLPHPLSAAELPTVAAAAVQVKVPWNTEHPFGSPLRRVSRIRPPDEQKRRDIYASPTRDDLLFG